MRILLAIAIILLTISLVLKVIVTNDKKETTIIISSQVSMEKAYFEGQRDALEGDIRIKKVDSCYVWTKSCWNSGKAPIFHPPLCK